MRRIRPRATTTCAAASTSSPPASRRRWWRRRCSGSRAEHRRKPPTARVRRSGMRARLGILGMLAACTLVLAGAAPAHAGGSIAAVRTRPLRTGRASGREPEASGPVAAIGDGSKTGRTSRGWFRTTRPGWRRARSRTNVVPIGEVRALPGTVSMERADVPPQHRDRRVRRARPPSRPVLGGALQRPVHEGAG